VAGDVTDQPPIIIASPPILVSREDAAALLAISLRHFNDHVAPHLRVVRLGQRKLYPLAELQHWATANAEAVQRR
jgi:hypothetical protein